MLLGAGPASFSSSAARSRAAAEAEAEDRKNETMNRHMRPQLMPTTAACSGWVGKSRHELAGRFSSRLGWY